MDKKYYVYILASDRNGTLYIGMTNNLVKRVWQHKNHQVEGFTSKHNVIKLVYYEIAEDATSAIVREKNIKSWKREWKIRIIEEFNNNWEDLYNTII
jgi:putative endonuclease